MQAFKTSFNSSSSFSFPPFFYIPYLAFCGLDAHQHLISKRTRKIKDDRTHHSWARCLCSRSQGKGTFSPPLMPQRTAWDLASLIKNKFLKLFHFILLFFKNILYLRGALGPSKTEQKIQSSYVPLTMHTHSHRVVHLFSSMNPYWLIHFYPTVWNHLGLCVCSISAIFCEESSFNLQLKCKNLCFFVSIYSVSNMLQESSVTLNFDPSSTCLCWHAQNQAINSNTSSVKEIRYILWKPVSDHTVKLSLKTLWCFRTPSVLPPCPPDQTLAPILPRPWSLA